ncbi:MAG: acyltransferase [Rhizobiaceae bacterium]|nr:acyltransferase [Rhizobiaceae bacterium]
MNRAFSTYLDALRFLAALTVVLSHWAYERFTGGAFVGIRDYNLGSDAVVVFFVLSGLVIAYTAETKDRTLGAFGFCRATRLLSVALPALALTFVLDRLGAHLDPPAYEGWWYVPRSLPEMLWNGLTFSSEWHMPGVRLGTNGPYWSLSYEVAYYLLFAAAFFLAGPLRILTLAVLALLIGVKVLLLLPVWLTGVSIWLRMRSAASAKEPRRLLWAMAVLPILVYLACLAAGVPGLLWRATVSAAGMEPDILRAVLGFSDEFLWNLLIGALVSIHLRAMWRLSRTWPATEQSWPANAIRWLAGASFSIYLVHYPVMQFADAVLPDTVPLRPWLLLGATLGACFFFAEAFERSLPELRSSLTRWGPPLASLATILRPADRPLD